jgi:xylan 1,4-beta-xylosidase
LPEQKAGTKDIKLVIKGGQGNRAVISRLDSSHGSFHAAYERMGKPVSPTREQIEALRHAAELPPPETRQLEEDHIMIALPANGLALVEVQMPPR